MAISGDERGFNSQNNLKSYILYLNGKYSNFSVNDFLNDESIYEFFGEMASQETYQWFFENKEYIIEEIIPSNESKIDNITFVYTGK